MSRAQPTAHVSTPPSGEVEWAFRTTTVQMQREEELRLAVRAYGLAQTAEAYFVARAVLKGLLRGPQVRVARVRARSWFAARDLAAAELGVTRDDVEVLR